ncbi:MAG: penicillin acylase family protein [Myxococcota bacterium]
MSDLVHASTRGLWILALSSIGLGASGCLELPVEPQDYEYRAVIRWTDHGVPHILAEDIDSAIYGQAYAFARLNGCVLADQVLKVRSERAMFFGAGQDDEHVRSDLVIKALEVYDNAEAELPQQPAQIQSMLQAYADGYNDFVAQRGDQLPCAEQPWLRSISPTDLFAYYIELGMLASSRQAHEFYWAAQPPGSASLEPAQGSVADIRTHRPGSNGWGIGRDRSANGHGMLVANPHFPWQGELKLFESHLRVPGTLDVYGASLMGVVGTLIGFNESVAWTHTVSDGQRLVVYNLELDPADPLRYMFDGQSMPLEAQTHEVMVLQEDGALTPASRTFYRSHHGLLASLPPLLWSNERAYAIRDANASNVAMISQFIGMNLARGMDDFQRVHDEQQGIPWVNTISTSKDGRAWYIDSTPTANLSPEAIDYFLQPPLDEDGILTGLIYDLAGLVMLPGNRSAFDWVVAEGARDPGLLPVTDVPRLERSDFVFNANDSHWLSNPLEPLTGFSPLHGFEQTPRSPRTRMNAHMLLDEEGLYSGVDGKFDLAELRDAILSNHGMMELLLRDAVVDRCQGQTTTETEAYGAVDIAPACTVLSTWDGTLDTDSVGAIVWRELLGDFGASDRFDAGALFAEAFDPASPVKTPRTLAEGERVLEALAGAVVKLEQAGIALDTPLGEVQHTVRAGERIPIHGGGSAEGVANLVFYGGLSTTLDEPLSQGTLVDEGSGTGLSDQGYVINYGSSFVMAMQFTDGDPEAYALLTYGQSDDPRSPYHVDQTRRFSQKDWRKVSWTEDDIEADPDLEIEVIFGFGDTP